MQAQIWPNNSPILAIFIMLRPELRPIRPFPKTLLQARSPQKKQAVWPSMAHQHTGPSSGPTTRPHQASPCTDDPNKLLPCVGPCRLACKLGMPPVCDACSQLEVTSSRPSLPRAKPTNASSPAAKSTNLQNSRPAHPYSTLKPITSSYFCHQRTRAAPYCISLLHFPMRGSRGQVASYSSCNLERSFSPVRPVCPGSYDSSLCPALPFSHH